MYQSPIAAHGFNHQSLFRQPVSNLRQIHEIVWNRNNETQQMSGDIPYAYSSIPNQQSVSEYENIANQVYASAHLNNAGIDNHGNSLAHNLSQTTEPDYLSTRRMYFVFFSFSNLKSLLRAQTYKYNVQYKSKSVINSTIERRTNT
jgi:hypothetical protein